MLRKSSEEAPLLRGTVSEKRLLNIGKSLADEASAYNEDNIHPYNWPQSDPELEEPLNEYVKVQTEKELEEELRQHDRRYNDVTAEFVIQSAENPPK